MERFFPVTYIGQMVPGTGYTCDVITPTTPCKINGVVPQNNGDYVDGGEGFTDPTPVQWDPRFGVAWSINEKTVLRVAGGTYHEAHGGFYVTGGPAYRFDRVVRYTDMGSFLTSDELDHAGERDRSRAPRQAAARVPLQHRTPAGAWVEDGARCRLRR